MLHAGFRSAVFALSCCLLVVHAGAARAATDPPRRGASTKAQAAALKAALAGADRALAAGDGRTAQIELAKFRGELGGFAVEQRWARAQELSGDRLGALALYENTLQTSAELAAEDRALALREVTRLTAGLAVVRFEATEPGVTLELDGRTIGATPLAGPVRLEPGTHELRARKSGFLELSRSVELPAGESKIDVLLMPEVVVGSLKVFGSDATEADVLLDGRVVGKLPWQSSLPPGEYVIETTSPTHSSPRVTVSIRPNEASSLIVNLTPRPARLMVRPREPGVAVTLDGAPLGVGAVDREVPPGKHTVTLEREGFQPQTQSLDTSPGESLTWTGLPWMPRADRVQKTEKKPSTQRLRGPFGRLALFGTIGKQSTDSVSVSCPATAAGGDCEGTVPFGGGLIARGGYNFGWFGVEGVALGLVDINYVSANYELEVTSSESPSSYGKPRDEDYTFYHWGGGLGAGVRLTTPTEGIRGTAGAAGAALFRSAQYARLAKYRGSVEQASVPDANTVVSDRVSYVSPALLFDVGLLLGSTPGFKLELAALLAVEFVPSDVSTEPRVDRLGRNVQGQAFETATPGLDVASGAQIFFGPVLGMQFGY